MSKYEELKVKLRDWRLSLQSDNKEAMLLAANAIESLERQLAKQDVEIARLKTVPMKYRRMEFNAQLQHKNTKLEAQLATVTAQRDLLKDLVAEVEGKYFAFLKEKDVDAEKFKAEGDMYGWNFHMGEKAGAVWMHLFMTELLKAASLKGE